MNNKGFTTIELILTLLLVIFLMTTITTVTYTYRDKSDYEQLKTEIINYKNNLTKIIYDDILDQDDLVVDIEKTDEYNYTLKTNKNNFPLTIINQDKKKGINYREVNYLIPGSEDSLITIEEINYVSDADIYCLDIIFSSRHIDEYFKIHLVTSNF